MEIEEYGYSINSYTSKIEIISEFFSDLIYVNKQLEISRLFIELIIVS